MKKVAVRLLQAVIVVFGTFYIFIKLGKYSSNILTTFVLLGVVPTVMFLIAKYLGDFLLQTGQVASSNVSWFRKFLPALLLIIIAPFLFLFIALLFDVGNWIESIFR